MKVILGMSGGVDSSVAAYLLKKEGYDVRGVSLELLETRGGASLNVCCSVQAINDAKETARLIGIGHSTLDAKDLFIERVIEPFIAMYSNGLTPNPCIMCNRFVKFPLLLKAANEMGAEFISTGHYARVESGILKKGIDPAKDQSYVLYALREAELARLVLPLGGLLKTDVRRIAEGLSLPSAQRAESQEICFVPEKNYSEFIGALAPEKEGPIIAPGGKVIGRHKGIGGFTIGQRKGLGVSTTEPLFVIKIDPAQNAVYVGPREAAMRRQFTVKEINRLIAKGNAFRADVKVRSMMEALPASVEIIDKDSVKVTYDEPQWAPAPGQSAVFYDGEIVIGGGIIEDIG